MPPTLADNLARAERALGRFRSSPVPHPIAGVPVAGSGETFANVSPVDGSALGQIAAGGVAEVDLAACAADEGADVRRGTMPASSSVASRCARVTSAVHRYAARP